jgi:hypothetical protein
MKESLSRIALILLAAGCDTSGAPGATAGAGSDSTAGDAGLDGEFGGASDANAPDGLKGCGPFVWSSPACASCMNQSCCDVEKLCAAIPTCAPLADCENSCDGSVSCQEGCGARYIDAISNYNAVLNCRFNMCAAECK